MNDGEEHPLRKWALLAVDYGTVCWCFVTFGNRGIFVVVYSGLCLASLLALAHAHKKWWRELRALEGINYPSRP